MTGQEYKDIIDGFNVEENEKYQEYTDEYGEHTLASLMLGSVQTPGTPL